MGPVKVSVPLASKKKTFKSFKINNMEKVTRELDCILTDDDKLDITQKLGDLIQEAEELESEKKGAMAEFKMKGDALDSQISHLGKMARTGIELRPVECMWQYNQPVRGMKQLIRLDTAECSEEVDMSERDKERVALLNQMSLPLQDQANVR